MMNENLKYYLGGFITSIVLILLITGVVVAYKSKLQSDLKEQLKQKDIEKAIYYTAKYAYTDERNSTIYFPTVNLSDIDVDCNFGGWGCSFSYTDVNGNPLFSDDFILENSTQHVYCSCRVD